LTMTAIDKAVNGCKRTLIHLLEAVSIECLGLALGQVASIH